MSEVVLRLRHSKKLYRMAVGILFFMQGLCFASWASRIPTIQSKLHLTDAALGMVLFALPVGSMVALPLAGWLVARLGSKKVSILALSIYSVLLVNVGFAQSVFHLLMGLALFGAAGNVSNIAINTQAVSVEAIYGRSIMASFHGLWSVAGFTAAAIGSVMIGKAIVPSQHFLIIMAVILLVVGLSVNYLLHDEKKATAGTPLFVKPDQSLINLGIIAFCCMICEGAMFDWSGIYFQKVVQADKAWIGAGYTAFMCTMAAGRFIADWFTSHFGFKKTLQFSGLLIATGLIIAVSLPQLVPAIIGFLLVGFGVSSVVPLVYSEAGKSKVLTPGMAIASVTSIGFLGFLIGPPLIGVVAGLFSLRISFLIIAVMGLNVALMAAKAKR